MLDFQVAYDKLISLETAEDIRHFLVSQDVKGVPSKMDSCAIAQWMTDQTGKQVRVNAYYMLQYNRESVVVKQILPITEAIRSFIRRFDLNVYPELISDDWEWATDDILNSGYWRKKPNA